MPRKKKSNLSKYTRAAKRMKLARSRGTAEDWRAGIKKEPNYHVETCDSDTYADCESRCSQGGHTATSWLETITVKPDIEIKIEGHVESSGS